MGAPPTAVLLLELWARRHLQGRTTRPLDGPQGNKRGRIPDIGQVNLGWIRRVLGINKTEKK